MRKRAVLLLTLALLVTAVGCGKKDKVTDNVEQTSDTKVEVSSETEATETSSTSSNETNGIYFESVEEVFQDKYLGTPDDMLYTSYTVKWGKAPIYFNIPEEDFFGAYDFGEDFIAIDYDKHEHFLARIYMGDTESFDVDKYIRDEYKERFNITDPEVSYVTEDVHGETLENPFTYYTNLVGYDGSMYSCSASYGTWTIKDEDTGTEYTVILLISSNSAYTIASESENLAHGALDISSDPTYLSSVSNTAKGDGKYTMYIYDLDNHRKTDDTITFKFPDKFISTDFRSKDNSWGGTEIGLFKKGYGIMAMAPYSSAFMKENFKTID